MQNKAKTLFIILFSILTLNSLAVDKLYSLKKVMECKDEIDKLVFQNKTIVFATKNIKKIETKIKKLDSIVGIIKPTDNRNRLKWIDRKNKALLCNYLICLKQFIYYSDFRLPKEPEQEKKWSVYYEPRIMHIYLDRYIKASKQLKLKFRAPREE